MLPLNPHTILVTRSASQSPQFRQLLEAQGSTVLEMPALTIGPPSSWAALDQALDRIQEFQWLILTSANGVTAWFERLAAQGITLDQCPSLKIAVVGQKTAAVLQRYGKTPDFIPPDFVADSLVSHFPEPLRDQSVLFPRVETGGRTLLAEEFRQQGSTVTEVPAYESRCPSHLEPPIAAALAQGRVTVVTFASSKTVTYFNQLITAQFGESAGDLLRGMAIASIGPQTSHTCRDLWNRVDIEAQDYTLEGLTAAIVAWAMATPTRSTGLI
ncbi:uroporphyrinogen-III synthase [Prochlorothrix hollandica]|uniref:Uroporphyrinogen-III synthase n=1 Tax=Prochlorothrix hollandica PCC 9006 = CALU 1027 TaxID=317619 RepID=A0A0M2Q2E7_PROHO|nr:uroporphyrinogen-III synthase [Prochlorothrix hollandica]KKJ00792.1 uroporphyrinogen-III synthase [Prochlorothrix hollandica PCC 9006 = CALU 1027]